MSENPPTPPLTFHCPNCGAALPAPDAASVVCQYCGTRALVPPEYLPKPAEDSLSSSPYPVQSATQPRRSRIPLAVLLIVLVGLFIIGIIGLTRMLPSTKTASQASEVVGQISLPSPSPAALIPSATPTPKPFASLVLQFGGEGSGAGKFEDSRFIAVDREGSIYAAEYVNGRVQKFDLSGKFVWMVNIPEAADGYTTIRDLAVGMDNRIYIVRSPDILIYDPDGSPAGIISGQVPDTNYDVLDIDPTNTLFAIHAGEDQTSLVKLNPQGEILLRADDLDGQLGKHFSLTSVRMVVDGLGSSYILNPSGAELYLFDSDGQFRDKLASKGQSPGQLNNPMNVAVDEDGRIYLINQGQIQVLDTNGSFLAGFDWDYSTGSAFDLTLDLGGNLYVITNNGHIFKYTVDILD